MKITLKTLKGQQLPLDVEPDMTVSEHFEARLASEGLCVSILGSTECNVIIFVVRLRY